MKVYIGTKVIQAEPFTRGKFKEAFPGVLNKETTTAEDAEDGYAVRYANKYVSWSPKDVFEAAYREVSGDETNLILSAMVANNAASAEVAGPAQGVSPEQPVLAPAEQPVEVPGPNPGEGVPTPPPTLDGAQA